GAVAGEVGAVPGGATVQPAAVGAAVPRAGTADRDVAGVLGPPGGRRRGELLLRSVLVVPAGSPAPSPHPDRSGPADPDRPPPARPGRRLRRRRHRVAGAGM